MRFTYMRSDIERRLNGLGIAHVVQQLGLRAENMVPWAEARGASSNGWVLLRGQLRFLNTPCKSRRSGGNSPAMTFLRALVVSCLILAVPTTALANAMTRGHCKDAAAPAATQTSLGHAGHAMHAGMSMGHEAMADHSGHGQGSKVVKGSCKCGCSCSGQHCASGGAGFLSTAIGDGMSLDAAGNEAATALVVQVSAAHHLDLLRPPAHL